MAKIFPSDWKSVQASGALGRKIETLRLLEGSLNDSYTVYHGVHWTLMEHGASILDGIDFVVVSSSGRVAMIEQKVGFLLETADGLAKLGGPKKAAVPIHLAHAQASLNARLASSFGEHAITVEGILFCPDYTVRDPNIAGVPAERIVDARIKHQLPQVVRQAASSDPIQPSHAAPGAARLHRFFADLLELAPDTAALRERTADWVTRLSEGLATWGLALEFKPHRLRVIGTAGSGKTQLALRVLERASRRHQRALYVCFNRPLADHLAGIVPAGTMVVTYHQLCDFAAHASGLHTDFSRPDVYRWLAAEFEHRAEPVFDPFDVLIVDEGQDFENTWVAPLLRQVKNEGEIYWLEDPLQNLYQREPVDLPDFVVLRAPTNFRSPRDIVTLLQRVCQSDPRFKAGSPLAQSHIELTSYHDAFELKEETKRAITHALAAGFTRADIVVLSFHGREHSALLDLDALGPHRLHTFTGVYDLLGNPVFREGDVRMESLYRFKGQAAPCVILTEIDFDELDEIAARKLFVGATRATMKLYVIATRNASRLIRGFLPDAATLEDGASEEAA